MEQENNELQLKQTPSLEELDQRELTAVQMRFSGCTSKEIAEATGYNDVYVRNLFMSEGRLERAYKAFAHDQQQKAQESVDTALNRARQEALQAIERIIALSKDASNEAAIFKANEFLLNVAGIKNETTLRTLFQNKTYEQAKKMVDEIFNEIFNKPVDDDKTIIYTWCERCNCSTHPEYDNPQQNRK